VPNHLTSADFHMNDKNWRENQMRSMAAILLCAAATLGGCSDMTPTQQRALGGTAIGATGGAVLGAIGGNAALGTAVGAAAGLAGGLIYNHVKESEQSAYQSGYTAGQQSSNKTY
jgi:hypothetical protein